MLHKRRPFSDAATASRCIIIKTRNRGQGDWHVPQVSDEIRQELKALWEASTHQTGLDISGRAADVWKPLIMVATACYDIMWLLYCYSEIEKAKENLKRGQEFEPDAMVVNALIALSHDSIETTLLVALSEIRENLRREYNWQPTSWAIGDMVRNLDFEVKASHGQHKVVIDKNRLAKVAGDLGIEV